MTQPPFSFTDNIKFDTIQLDNAKKVDICTKNEQVRSK